MKRNTRLFQIGIGLFSLSLMFTNATKKRSLANVVEAARIDHARELLGDKYYDKSPVFETEGYNSVNDFVYEEVKRQLPEKYQKKAFFVAQALIAEANKFELDPTFVMAVIQHESRFNPEALGGVGEIGLMQIRPETAEWLTKKFGVKWKGKNSLLDPSTNISIGVLYLSYLREMFGHGRLYLSAYNMGPKKLRSNLSKNVWPREYSSGVMKKYMELNKALATKAALEKITTSNMIALHE